MTLSKCLIFLDEILINYKNKQDFKIIREFYDEIFEMILSSLVYYFKVIENNIYFFIEIILLIYRKILITHQKILPWKICLNLGEKNMI